jgi:hypothetical protein
MKVGTDRPPTNAIPGHGTYIGEGKLNNKTAMIQVAGVFVYAQFDDFQTGHGFGWWKFPITKWRVH